MRTFNDSDMQKYGLVIYLLMLINIRSCVSLVNSMECNNTDYIKNTTANLLVYDHTVQLKHWFSEKNLVEHT